MQVSKGWEGSRPQPIELIPEHFYLLGLLLCNVKELALVGDLFDLLAWISLVVAHRVRLQTHDLHTVVHLYLELTSTSLKLL